MKVLCLSYAPSDAKFGSTNRISGSEGRRRLIRLNRSKRVRYFFKILLGTIRNEGWLRSFSAERKQDCFWLIAL